MMLAVLVSCPAFMQAKDYVLKSPDGKLETIVSAGDSLTYSIRSGGKELLSRSPVGLVLENRTLGKGPKVRRDGYRKDVEETVRAFNYRVPSFAVAYNELNLEFKGGYGVQFRAYDEGIAYRFYTCMKDSLVIRDEVAELNFPQNYTAYMAYSTSGKGSDPFAMAFQNIYAKASLDDVDGEKIAFLPLAVDCGDGVKMTLLESDLEDYPGMFVRKGKKSNSLQAVFAPYPTSFKTYPPRAMKRVVGRTGHIARVKGTRNFPWRIWAVSEKDTEMPLNNLVYALASPNRIGDTSWIKGGKAAWEWWNDWGIYGVNFKAGINMQTYKHYIDFAAKNGLEFVILDEGWYNPGNGDMLAVVPELDLPELVRYGKEKGVGLILWTVFNVLDDQLEEACRKYSEMGICGFKVDFLDRDDQTAVEMAYRIAEATARYKLTLDLHGFYKPTGMNRTYPNIINYESVFGMEEMKWSSVEKDMMEYDVTMPYIRMMAGPVDYTPGAMRNASKNDFKPVYYNPMSQGTRCHQLAAYVVHDSPLTMLADNPTVYERERECTDFIASVPNIGLDETLVLQGKLGESVVIARRKGNAWYVGGMTDWSPRDITLDFSFLGEGKYVVTLFRDGVNADKQAEDYVKETFTVTSSSRKFIHMSSGGGFAMSVLRE